MADVAALIMLLVAASMSGLRLTVAATGAVLLTALTYMPLLVFSGGFGQINGLPHWLNQLMSYLPIQPAVSGVMSGLQHPGVTPGRDLLAYRRQAPLLVLDHGYE